MARVSKTEKLYRGADAVAWIAEHGVYKQGMTKAQLHAAAKAKGAGPIILMLIQMLGPVLLKLLESLLAPKTPVAAKA